MSFKEKSLNNLKKKYHKLIKKMNKKKEQRLGIETSRGPRRIP